MLHLLASLFDDHVSQPGHINVRICEVDSPVRPRTLITLTSLTGCLAAASILTVIYAVREDRFREGSVYVNSSEEFVVGEPSCKMRLQSSQALVGFSTKSWRHVV